MGRGFAVAVELDVLIGEVAVIEDVWELDGSVDSKDDEEADERAEVACEDGEVDDVEDSRGVDDVDDETATDGVETALTTVMVE